MESVAIPLVGWPGILTSLLLIAVALQLSRAGIALAGAMIGTPFLLYLSGAPRFQYIAPLVLVAYYLVPIAIARHRKGLAIVCAVPYAAMVIVMMWIVIGQNRA